MKMRRNIGNARYPALLVLLLAEPPPASMRRAGQAPR